MPSVLFVTETAHIGGAEINLLLMAPRLQQRGWQVTVILPARGALYDRLQELGVPVRLVPRPPLVETSILVRGRYKVPNPLSLLINAPLALLWVVRLWFVFRTIRPDVVHTLSMWTHALAALAARLCGSTVIWHFQDIVDGRSGFGLYRFLVHRWARLVPHCIIVISDRVAEQFAGETRVVHKLRKLENTIDVTVFEGVAPARVHGTRVLTLGTVARFTPWKGQEIALQAARLLAQQGICFRWQFAGNIGLGVNQYYTYLQELVAQWQLTDKVNFVGWISDIPAFYGELDIFVHVPVEPEPFGLVLAEAMAAGLPVVTTTGGGAQQMVEAGGGILIPPRDPQELADTLVRLALDTEECARRGQQASTFAQQTFDVHQYMDNLVSIYTEIIGNC